MFVNMYVSIGRVQSFWKAQGELGDTPTPPVLLKIGPLFYIVLKLAAWSGYRLQ
jgi:hypothetical protein